MKRTAETMAFSILTLIFLTAGAMPVSAIDLVIESVTVAPGETFDVKVFFSETNGLSGGQVFIAYDDAILSFNDGSVTSGPGQLYLNVSRNLKKTLLSLVFKNFTKFAVCHDL